MLLADSSVCVFPCNQKPVIVIEVGVSQYWGGPCGLHNKMRFWFSQFPSMQCVILVKIYKRTKSFACELWERQGPRATMPAARAQVRTSLPLTSRTTFFFLI